MKQYIRVYVNPLLRTRMFTLLASLFAVVSSVGMPFKQIRSYKFSYLAILRDVFDILFSSGFLPVGFSLVYPRVVRCLLYRLLTVDTQRHVRLTLRAS